MNILYITTVGSTMDFFVSLISELVNAGDRVDIATNELHGEKKVNEIFKKLGCKIYPISCVRSPLKFGNYKTIEEIRNIVYGNNYDVVHCHTPIAAVCARIACKNYRKSGLKVIYTSHGYHFYYGAPFISWILYFPIEWLCSFWTDITITINREDFNITRQFFHPKQTAYVPGVGVDTKRYNCRYNRDEVRDSIGVPKDAILLVSVGELNKNKNHSVIIKALAKIKDKRIHYVIAGRGELKEYLQDLSEKEGMGSNIHFIGFRDDVPRIYASADVCVFPSIREGLGLAAVEGMASGLPLIVSDNRGTRGFLTDNNAIICRYDDIVGFKNAIITMAENNGFRERLGRNNVEKSKQFDIRVVNEKMKRIYASFRVENAENY